MHYIEHDGTEYYFTMNSFPTFLDKKVKLLNYFMNYMKEHLLKAGANIKMRYSIIFLLRGSLDFDSQLDDFSEMEMSCHVFLHWEHGSGHRGLSWCISLTEPCRLFYNSSKVCHNEVPNVYRLNFQINFFKDHTKIILCPLLGGITYIDEDRNPRTYSLELIEKYGCNAELASR